MVKKTTICLFNEAKESWAHGVGTYINQLAECLRSSGLDIIMVNLCTKGREVTEEKGSGYRQIMVPTTGGLLRSMKDYQYYLRNAAFLLKEHLGEASETHYFFHLNFMSSEYLAIYLKKLFHDCRIILSVHYKNWNIDLLGDENRLRRILDKPVSEYNDFEEGVARELSRDYRFMNICDRVICVAQHAADTYRKFAKDPLSNITVIHNAVADKYKDLPQEVKQKLRKHYHFDDDTSIILFAGRLEELKGVSPLIEAFKKHAETHPHSHLILAGDGKFHSYLPEAKPCWSKISFIGKVDQKTLYELYSIADIGVACSLYEEFGLVAIEMMMHRLPVIVSEAGGLAEIVEDGVTGLKVPVRFTETKPRIDPDILAEKINYLTDHPHQAQILAANAREAFLKKFEISVLKEKILKLYKV